MSGNVLFGDWGSGPRAQDPEVQYMPTPIGEECFECEEPIAFGDCGEFMLYHGTDSVRSVPIHRECMMLKVIGHQFGVCSCTDYAGTTTKREAALELARRVDGEAVRRFIQRPEWPE